jgi:anti-anti-sigma factor
MFTLKTREVGEILIVDFIDQEAVGTAAVQQIGEEFDRLTLDAHGVKGILLNLNKVEFISSAVIGKIVRLNKQCKTDKLELKLCNASLGVRDVFKTTMLNKMLDVQPDEETALASFAGR